MDRGPWSEAMRRGDYGAAAQLAEAAGDSHGLVVAIGALGRRYDEEVRDGDAEGTLRRAMATADERLATTDPKVLRAHARLDLTAFLCRVNRYAEAIPLIEEALGIVEAARGVQHADVASVLVKLASRLVEGRAVVADAHARADRALQRAIAILENEPELEDRLAKARGHLDSFRILRELHASRRPMRPSEIAARVAEAHANQRVATEIERAVAAVCAVAELVVVFAEHSVAITGVAASAADRDRAAQIAGRHEQVREIVNQLRVR